ncbi:MAG TPA: hypothetical protein VFN64_06200 [Burkholderiaceae bacterium]|nr:hypothetical protein [Burkholderiaceae bacterium]
MKAIKDVERYLSQHPGSPSAEVLSRLPGTLAREESLKLGDLYTLDWDSFELAIELLRDWRIDRYFVNRAELSPASAEHPQPDAVAE